MDIQLLSFVVSLSFAVTLGFVSLFWQFTKG